MKLLDKIILGVLVGLVPLAMIVAVWYFSDRNSDTISSDYFIDTTALETVIKESISSNQPVKEEVVPFTISSVTYASDSGIFRIAGKAPQSQRSVFVSVSLLKNPTTTPTPTPTPRATPRITPKPTPKSGLPVEFFLIEPDSASGNFEYEYLVPADEMDQLLEIRLEQEAAVKTIRFDLGKKTQVY